MRLPMHIFVTLFLSSFQETDFVCFDTGFDKFDNYDIDLLLGSSVEQNDESENKGTSDQIQVPEDTPKETLSSAEVESDSENPAELDDEPEDLDKVPDDPSSSLPKLEVTTEHPPIKVVESHTAATPDTAEKASKEAEIEQENTVESVLQNVVSESNETKDTLSKSEVESVPEDEKKNKEENKAVSVSEGVQIPELKTTFGTTFDAVTTDEEITKKVTPYEEEESKDVRSHPEDDINVKEETPLLSFSKESAKTLESDTIKQQGIPPIAHDGKPGEAFSVGTEVETAAQDLSSEEDDDEDEEEEEEEEAVARTHSSFEEAKKDVEEPLIAESPKEPENIDQVLQHQESSSVQLDNKETVSDSKELLLHSEDESDGEVIKHEKDLNETLLPIDDTAESDRNHTDNQTESNPVSQDHILDNPEAEKSDIKNTDEPPTEDNEEEEATSDSEIIEDIADTQDSSVAVDHREEFDKTFDEHKMETNQESVITEHENLQASEKMQSHDLDEENIVDASLSNQIPDSLVKDEEKIVDATPSGQIHDPLVKDEEKTIDDSLPGQVHDPIVRDEEKIDDSLPGQIHNPLVKDEEKMVDDSLPGHINHSSVTDLETNNIQPELFVEEPDIPEELYSEEREDENDTEMEEDKNEGKEELLEDENALSFSQSDNTDSDKPSPEMETLPSESTTEPEYSDSVMRLTLLRDHFTEEYMQRFQKLLGLKNLVKVEAMFSDLDTELQATRLSQTGTMQDIENALESILESSENTILDEIEKMLDSWHLEHNYDNQMDINSVDEETEILDDFQELALSLRHKYSTVSDSTPLATEQASDIHQGRFDFNYFSLYR